MGTTINKNAGDPPYSVHDFAVWYSMIPNLMIPKLLSPSVCKLVPPSIKRLAVSMKSWSE